LPGLTPPELILVAAGVLRDASGRVLITQRPDGKHAAGFWEFPGGKIQAGESPLQALCRELAEEIGIQVSAATPLMTFRHSYPNASWNCTYSRSATTRVSHKGSKVSPCAGLTVAELGSAGLLEADQPIAAAL
jgi:8-oxo-dGTP diphosphatase